MSMRATAGTTGALGVPAGCDVPSFSSSPSSVGAVATESAGDALMTSGARDEVSAATAGPSWRIFCAGVTGIPGTSAAGGTPSSTNTGGFPPTSSIISVMSSFKSLSSVTVVIGVWNQGFEIAGDCVIDESEMSVNDK